MVFLFFSVSLYQNIYLLLMMVRGGIVYTVRECFIYFLTVRTLGGFHYASLLKKKKEIGLHKEIETKSGLML